MIQKMGIMGNIFRYLPNSIYGYDIAVKDALSAILRYGTFQSLVVFYDPRQYQEHIIRKIIKELQNRGQINAEIEFISTYELLKGSSQPQFDVMHNIGMEFLPQIYYRENISNTPFPYIYTLHCASSPNYRNDLFFQKLLSPFHHYDSLICTSEASKRAVQAILNNISNSIAEEYNIHLKYKGRLDVIPLGVDTNYFAPLSDMQRKDNRAKYNIPKSAFVLLWMGRISALDKADLQPLIMVLYRLIRKNHDSRLYNSYEACPDTIRLIVNSLEVYPTDSVVDIGCGKGYAMYAMAQKPFSQIDGIEICPHLAETALHNLSAIFGVNFEYRAPLARETSPTLTEI